MKKLGKKKNKGGRDEFDVFMVYLFATINLALSLFCLYIV